ncbi:hypothetical protein N7465_007843 [Penicillium sp. CMV-2018d]|nr:hypothetical protein N7465_007843 [Penicillium sp. CMV-2018d]
MRSRAKSKRIWSGDMPLYADSSRFPEEVRSPMCLRIRPNLSQLSETEITIRKNVIQPGFSRAIERHRRGPGPNS